MALVKTDLAQALYDSLGQTTDKDGNQTLPTDMAEIYAEALIDMLQAATFFHTPGTVNALGYAVNSPVKSGEVEGGIATGGFLSPLNYVDFYTPLYQNAIKDVTNPSFLPPITSSLTSYCTTVVTYIQTNTSITVPTITGSCTAVQPDGTNPGVPGILAGGEGANGFFIGLDGNVLTTLVAATFGLPEPPSLRPFHIALCDYLLNNAECSYDTGTVTGSFLNAPSPIPLTGGSGAGGLIE